MTTNDEALLDYMQRWFDTYSANLRAVGNDTVAAGHVIEGMQEGLLAVQRYVEGKDKPTGDWDPETPNRIKTSGM